MGVTPEEQRRRITAICARPRWVLDTAYSQWLDVPLARVQLIVALDYPRWLSLGRLMRRTLLRAVDHRPVCNGNTETFRAAFSRDSIIVWHFRSFARKRSRIRAWAADPPGCAVVRLRSRAGHPPLAGHAARGRSRRRIGPRPGQGAVIGQAEAGDVSISCRPHVRADQQGRPLRYCVYGAFRCGGIRDGRRWRDPAGRPAGSRSFSTTRSSGREPLGHGVFVRRAQAAEFLHERSAVPGQVERIVPAVGRVPASFDQPAFFEAIHQWYEPAGRST